MVQVIEGNEKLTEFSTMCSLQSRAVYNCRLVAIGNSSAPFHPEKQFEQMCSKCISKSECIVEAQVLDKSSKVQTDKPGLLVKVHPTSIRCKS
jgi:hypothetical protein